ncbi:MAG TPA: hypothetical protein VKR31_16570 [Rhizomicrobium sp.]|nr:hypothetical protein [Rhizomicrobium sp.]
MPTYPELDPLHLFLGDPILLVGTLLPVVMIGGVLIFRIRQSRKLAALTKQNAQAIEQNAARWDESVARTEKMIGLLTEIRDHMARIAPRSPTA